MTYKFGEYLTTQLQRKSWSASQLAKEAGMSHVYLREILQGGKSEGIKKKIPPKISVDILERLSEALDIHVLDLFLAYKGVLPSEEDKSEVLNLDFEKAVYLLATKHGYNLEKIPLEAREKMLSSMANLTVGFLDVLFQHEIKKIG